MPRKAALSVKQIPIFALFLKDIKFFIYSKNHAYRPFILHFFLFVQLRELYFMKHLFLLVNVALTASFQREFKIGPETAL